MFERALGQLNVQISKAIFSFVKTPGAERGRAGVPLLAVRMQEQEITSTKAIVREILTMKFTAALLTLAVSHI